MKTQTLYRLEVSNIDGRGPGTVKAYTKNLSVAENWVELSPGWNDYYKVDMVIIDSIDELENVEKERKKQAALNKLSSEEKRLLGLE
jgi:hypothetical protein